MPFSAAPPWNVWKIADHETRDAGYDSPSRRKMRDKFEVLSVADIFAAAIENVYLDKPMSKLYD